MNKEKKSKDYAADARNLDNLKVIIEKAYLDGYNEGVKDYFELNKFPQIIEEDGIEYVDLGLPSGTLWALKNASRVPFAKAAMMIIPSLDQILELAKYTKCVFLEHPWYQEQYRFKILDSFGKEYFFVASNYDDPQMETGTLYFWYKGEFTPGEEAPVYFLGKSFHEGVSKVSMQTFGTPSFLCFIALLRI